MIPCSIFDIRFFKVSFTIRLDALLARGSALVKLHLKRTAEYRISNRRMSKGGIASLSLF
ncbi:hypothetical protein D1AOALGA4SA_8433 [Olavius algarvensis Delta 1 endosymbiont]|nr:hypothetical protein D1AOALGA4SA_8433 [Olavius algarvensis Delta 1 endosymbiont]